MIAPAPGVWERLPGVYDGRGEFALKAAAGDWVDPALARWALPAGLVRQQAAWIRFEWEGSRYEGAVFVKEAIGDAIYDAEILAWRVQ